MTTHCTFRVHDVVPPVTVHSPRARFVRLQFTSKTGDRAAMTRFALTLFLLLVCLLSPIADSTVYHWKYDDSVTRDEMFPHASSRRQLTPSSSLLSSFRVKAYTKVVCDATIFDPSTRKHSFSHLISGSINYLNESIIQPHCPCAYDPTNRCRRASHFCFGPNSTYACSYHIYNATVTDLGAIFAGRLSLPEVISLSDTTLMAEHAPQYQPTVVKAYDEWLQSVVANYKNYPSLPKRHVRHLIPLRMRWDDCFNHLSFQSMPLIGLVYELHPEIFYATHWHASRFTAALLFLLGVKTEKVIIEESVHAKDVMLPWMKHWNPISSAPLQGIARRVSLLATKRLLSTQIPETIRHSVDTLQPLDAQYRVMSKLNISQDEENHVRYVVYFNRTAKGTRNVVNELEILEAITEHLLPQYKLIVLPSTKEYKSIPEMHAMWQQYARIVNRAAVMIGPHGGGLNNMMWAPDDCDLIEFNEYLDDEHYTHSHGETPVRRVFMNAFWSRAAYPLSSDPLSPHNLGGLLTDSLNKDAVNQSVHFRNKFWMIQPVKRHFQDMYAGRLKICIRDILRVLSQIPQYGQLQKESAFAVGLLRDNAVWGTMECEAVGTFTVPPKGASSKRKSNNHTMK